MYLWNDLIQLHFFSNNNTNDYMYTADTKILDFLATSCVIN